jgi:hypothetical protein
MYLFSGKIKCADCLKNYRGKRDREKEIYICNGYHNKNSNCERNRIKEKYLVDLINRHIEIIEQKYRRGDYLEKFPFHVNEGMEQIVNSYVEWIEAKRGYLKIYYKDNSDTLIYDKSNNY